ncbi:hypothetical protein [Pseudomonas sp.]|uniref:hypothetical protein n=1 Tax=Pseudomonas sp. TaxID=306 RepID=UPI0029070175|nr:hypothetical protein [Pseudomonas sp.]MDU4251701.1 hypothetical protein [Pseudomonas sp.]
MKLTKPHWKEKPYRPGTTNSASQGESDRLRRTTATAAGIESMEAAAMTLAATTDDMNRLSRNAGR